MAKNQKEKEKNKKKKPRGSMPEAFSLQNVKKHKIISIYKYVVFMKKLKNTHKFLVDIFSYALAPERNIENNLQNTLTYC